MQQQNYKAVMARFTREQAEALEIMASILGLPVSEYVVQATMERLSGDVPLNIAAYEAVRAARERQQKGA